MKTITTQRGEKVKLLEPSEWSELMLKQFGQGSGLAAFEQMVMQSRQHKVCIECLTTEKLHLRTNYLLPTDGYHSRDYWMCEDCIDYYEVKNGEPPIYGRAK